MSSNEVRLEKTEAGELLFSVMAERDALKAENERLQFETTELTERLEQLSVEAGRVSVALDDSRAENQQLRAALTEITDLELEGDASLADAIHIADEALNP